MLVSGTSATLPDPAKVSALVVGNGWYPDLENGAPLEGAAQQAERFATWLLDRGICLAQRITLMTTSPPGGSAATELTGDKAAGINAGDSVEPRKDTPAWLTGEHGPSDQDQLFLLFWVGHGYTDPDDPDKRLYLLGSDAEPLNPWNVTLSQVLHWAAQAAPNADIVAFVNACRGPIDWRVARLLTSANFSYQLPRQDVRQRLGRQEAVAYAAAHGENTRDAGWTHETFADDVLRRLEDLPAGATPFEIFDDGLKESIIDIRRGRGIGDFSGTVSLEHGRNSYRFTTPLDRQYLFLQEWQELLAVARDIDDDPAARPATRVRWGAYSFAMGWVDGSHRPDEIETVEDLVWALSDRPPQRWNWAPPIVFACAFLASKSASGSQTGLADWCRRWAGAHGSDAANMLDAVNKQIPEHMPGRPCLTITVDVETRLGNSRRFSLVPRLYAMERPENLREHRGITQDMIPETARLAIDDALDSGAVEDPADLLVEFIVPSALHGWRLEHAGGRPLGNTYAVAIRSLDIVRRPRGEAASWIRKKLKEIEAYKPTPEMPWSAKIEWFTCAEKEDHPSREAMAKAPAAGERFCIVLARRVNPKAGRNGRVTLAGGRVGMASDPPMGLSDAIKNGASPIVLSMLEEIGCRSCLVGQACQVSLGKDLVVQRVNSAENGLLDLPYIIRDIRSYLVGKNPGDLHFGVYMESLRRLPFEDSLRSQFAHPV